MKDIIDMAADRGMFIDQSQSMNLFMQSPNKGKLTSMHMYAWEAGLKTGLYYLRTKSATDAIKFTVEKQVKSQVTPVVATDEGSKEKEAAAEAMQAENMASFEESTAEMNAKTMGRSGEKELQR